MIIDCPYHAGKADGLIGPWDTAAPLEKYLRRATQADINRTVLLAALYLDYLLIHQSVFRSITRSSPRTTHITR